MEKMRRPFQGVTNVIRFNWHFYASSFGFVLLGVALTNSIAEKFQLYSYLACFFVTGTMLISLLSSYYVYDLSGLYELKWLEGFGIERGSQSVNINAGFDETSHLLTCKFKLHGLVVLDFYDPLKHTEVSIKRARAAYPSFPGTTHVTTTNLPLGDRSIDSIFVIFSAHEIRNENERIAFFKELERIIKPAGQIFVTEHLRDPTNFLAYNIGFLHFYSKSTWRKTFQSAQLNVRDEVKLTPFVSTFILTTHGDSL